MAEPTAIFSEIREYLRPSMTLTSRYSRLYALLQRLCMEHSAELNTDFSGLFSRLYAVCRAKGIDYHEADRFRRNARRVLLEKAVPTEAQFTADVALLCTFVCRLYQCALPADFPAVSGKEAAPLRSAQRRLEKLRAVVTAVSGTTFSCITSEGELTVAAPELARTTRLLTPNVPVNLLDVEIAPDATATVQLVILEPDFLLDVSALTESVKHYGATPYTYLLGLMTPRTNTLPILLGNAANQFMDDLVNATCDLHDAAAQKALYKVSLQKHFRDNMLQYVCLEEPVTKEYFDKLEETFRNISSIVADKFPTVELGLPLDNVLLEPAFICETLGLRGRLDVMSADHHSLVELKSGKADEFKNSPQEQHILQMSLYKEMLHYNFKLQRDSVKSFLLYSKYPVLYNQRVSKAAVTAVIELRNEIVALESRVRAGQGEQLLSGLTPAHLNVKQMTGKLWTQYLEPQIKNITQTLNAMSPLEKAYFYHFLTFIEREKFLSKTTDNRPDSNRGLASAWTTDLQAKLASGDILINLRLTDTEGADGIEMLTFDLPDYGENFIANFSKGEMVQLYERNSAADGVTTRQLVRGYVEELDTEHLKLRLGYKQRNRLLFPSDSLYAIEHDGSDALFKQYVGNLFSLFQASPRRRDLLLGQRQPEVDAEVPRLLGDYPEATAAVVRQVRQAKDYFLLVGPPGTGKTSVALRAMVNEFLLEEKQLPSGVGLMLMAFTNRAVDEICEMLTGLSANYVRIGAEQICGAEFRPHLMQNKLSGCLNRDAVRKFLLEIPIYVGTVTMMSNHLELFNLRPFYAIVDEASQVLEPQILGLLSAKCPDGHSGIRKFVLIGDHKQLPAVVMLPQAQTVVQDQQLLGIGLEDLRNSLFQRLHTLQQRSGQPGIVAMLESQGRMHGDICDFVNSAFYGGHLHPVPLPHQDGPIGLENPANAYEAFVASTRKGFIDVVPSAPLDNNKANAYEAEEVAQIVAAILSLNARNGIAIDPVRQIGVIVPFRNQISMVRSALLRHGMAHCTDITIDTVECYQGSQRDYIIFSTTISKPYQLAILSSPQTVEGQSVDRKLNVALTRARLQFFMVGNAALLSGSEIYKNLIKQCDKMRRE
ncbi:MAG: AAA domain-containing protein [Bacteroidales bacterium]|nr:AAA domain-containing protein [Bacteroidales bacterium]